MNTKNNVDLGIWVAFKLSFVSCLFHLHTRTRRERFARAVHTEISPWEIRWKWNRYVCVSVYVVQMCELSLKQKCATANDRDRNAEQRREEEKNCSAKVSFSSQRGKRTHAILVREQVVKCFSFANFNAEYCLILFFVRCISVLVEFHHYEFIVFSPVFLCSPFCGLFFNACVLFFHRSSNSTTNEEKVCWLKHTYKRGDKVEGGTW